MLGIMSSAEVRKAREKYRKLARNLYLNSANSEVRRLANAAKTFLLWSAGHSKRRQPVSAIHWLEKACDYLEKAGKVETMTKIGKVHDTANKIAWELKGQSFKGNGWGQRHFDAWFSPRAGFEAGFSVTMKGLATLADAHFDAYGSPLGEDGVVGSYWLDTLKSLMRMRDGEHGRFDSGGLGDMARGMAAAAGFSKSEVAEIP